MLPHNATQCPVIYDVSEVYEVLTTVDIPVY